MTYQNHASDLKGPRKAEALFNDHAFAIACRTDRLLQWLLILEWIAGVITAVCISPKAWNGPSSDLHANVWAAIFLGGAVSSLPVLASLRWRGSAVTRHIIAVGQMMMSALLFHLSGGHIETRFYIFGSLAFLSFYRDWRVLATATFMTALDHFAGGLLWPGALYGAAAAPEWHALERAGWVVFEDVFLLIAMRQSIFEMHNIANRQALLESVNERIEETVVERTAQLTSEITERKRAEKSLRLLQLAIDQSKDSVMITEAELDLPGPRIIFVNPAYTRMTGYTPEETIGRTPRLLQGPRTDRATLRQLRQHLERGEEFEGEVINYRKDGKQFHLEWQIAPIRDVDGITTHFVAIQRDITERKRFESQLFQSQKLETLGRLAGGFAHEFNTILSSIIGQSELVFAALPSGSALAKNTGEIRTCANRAAKLTRQLLAYGRKQMLQPKTLDINELLSSMQQVIAETVGDKIMVEYHRGDALPLIKADVAQIEEVVIHVVSNARDAMPNGGKLTFATSKLVVGENSADEYYSMKAGQYVVVAFADTGSGMSAETKARAFDPFFSTKGVGKGTGLGLATCYGIIKQSGGYLQLESELAVGSTLKIYLPQTIAKPTASVGVPPAGFQFKPRNRNGTILIVDGDATFCDLAALVLEKSGYEILPTTDPEEALRLAQGVPRIDLLLAGVGEVPFCGKALAKQIRSFHPLMKVLFTSARHEDAATHQTSFDGTSYFIRKPFTPSTLGSEIRYILEGVGASSEAEDRQMAMKS